MWRATMLRCVRHLSSSCSTPLRTFSISSFPWNDRTALRSTVAICRFQFKTANLFSTNSSSDGNEGKDSWYEPSDLSWDSVSSWSTGLTKDHFDGDVVGRKTSHASEDTTIFQLNEIDDKLREYDEHLKGCKEFMDGWDDRLREVNMLLDQAREPGLRGSYLKDSEKAEMYRLHKENPDVYTVERLAKDYRIMRQRVHAILWLKEDQEEMEKNGGCPLDDSIEVLIDSFPEFFKFHDREFHVASLPYKPHFKVMPEGWAGTVKDLDEVHYQISKKEDEIIYQDFVRRMNFNKMKIAGKVKCHKYSRQRPAMGWSYTVEKLGRSAKTRSGVGFRFVSLPDGSSRPLNETEKVYVQRETPRRRRRILP